MREEGNTDRRAVKVFSRERLGVGRLRIIYRGGFGDDSFASAPHSLANQSYRGSRRDARTSASTVCRSPDLR